ncbi:hypothetical protein D3C81_1707160 [compost metagenome]
MMESRSCAYAVFIANYAISGNRCYHSVFRYFPYPMIFSVRYVNVTICICVHARRTVEHCGFLSTVPPSSLRSYVVFHVKHKACIGRNLSILNLTNEMISSVRYKHRAIFKNSDSLRHTESGL